MSEDMVIARMCAPTLAGIKTGSYWKVYGNVAEAERKFDAYRRCTNWFLRSLQSGRQIERLTVAI